jgi:hypothetical protein
MMPDGDGDGDGDGDVFVMHAVIAGGSSCNSKKLMSIRTGASIMRSASHC